MDFLTYLQNAWRLLAAAIAGGFFGWGLCLASASYKRQVAQQVAAAAAAESKWAAARLIGAKAAKAAAQAALLQRQAEISEQQGRQWLETLRNSLGD